MEGTCYATEFNIFEGGRIDVFGGSFDPVHDGHIHLAKLAKEALDLDEVRFMPCKISPHKTDRPPTPGNIRVEWLQIALAGIPWAKIDQTELQQEGASYSYKILQSLVSGFSADRWF